MTLAAFQQTFAELAASPQLVLAVRRDPATALAGRDLSPREQHRLVRVAGHRGMEAQCSLYRITRLAALNSVLPLTLAALQEALRPLVDGYWEQHPIHEVQFLAEARRFLAYLEGQPDRLAALAGAAAGPLVDLAALELAVEAMRLATPGEDAPAALHLSLRHRAEDLLSAAAGGLAALGGVPPAREDVAVLCALPGQAPEIVATAG